jgi:hypothetical protein
VLKVAGGSKIGEVRDVVFFNYRKGNGDKATLSFALIYKKQSRNM